MSFGDKEWLEKVNKHYTFPCIIAFNLIKEHDGTTAIVSTLVKTKSKLENVKYNYVRADTWTSAASAVLSAKEIKSAEEYLQESKRLNELWSFAIISKATN